MIITGFLSLPSISSLISESTLSIDLLIALYLSFDLLFESSLFVFESLFDTTLLFDATLLLIRIRLPNVGIYSSIYLILLLVNTVFFSLLPQKNHPLV